jgi:hypothetical protein
MPSLKFSSASGPSLYSGSFILSVYPYVAKIKTQIQTEETNITTQAADANIQYHQSICEKRNKSLKRLLKKHCQSTADA